MWCYESTLFVVPFSLFVTPSPNHSFCLLSYFLSRSVRKPYLRVSYHVYIFDWFLVRGGPFPSHNCLSLSLNIFSGGDVGNLTRSLQFLLHLSYTLARAISDQYQSLKFETLLRTSQKQGHHLDAPDLPHSIVCLYQALPYCMG